MDCISVSTLDSDSPIDVSAVQSLFFCIFPDFGEGLVETRRAFPGSGGIYRGIIRDAVVLDDAFDGERTMVPSGAVMNRLEKFCSPPM